MQLRPRFVGRLGLADAVSVANATLGFVAVVVATVDPGVAARLVLLAAIADGLDGVIARLYGSTPLGEYVDSLADVASFGIAPAVLVFAIAHRGWDLTVTALTPRTVAVVAIPAVFVAAAIIRLGMYTAYDLDERVTQGVQTTLAGTILAAGYLAGVTNPTVLLAATLAFTYLMITEVTYPELHERDAVAMGGVQFVAIIAPMALGRVFPRLLLAFALAYLLLAPWFYWRDSA